MNFGIKSERKKYFDYVESLDYRIHSAKLKTKTGEKWNHISVFYKNP